MYDELLIELDGLFCSMELDKECLDGVEREVSLVRVVGGDEGGGMWSLLLRRVIECLGFGVADVGVGNVVECLGVVLGDGIAELLTDNLGLGNAGGVIDVTLFGCMKIPLSGLQLKYLTPWMLPSFLPFP